jgi:predicted DCC family thiol-disulfide oxidoreductase YuxK
MTSPTARPALTVYFDGSCPLCRREIALYQRLPSRQAVAWVDVSQPVDCGDGLSCATAMRRFHVRDEQDRLLSGAAAFSRLWRCYAGWRVLGWVTSVPPMSWLAELAYRLFLPVRPRVQAWVQRWSREGRA